MQCALSEGYLCACWRCGLRRRKDPGQGGARRRPVAGQDVDSGGSGGGGLMFRAGGRALEAVGFLGHLRTLEIT